MDTREQQKQELLEQIQYLGDARASGSITESVYNALAQQLRSELVAIDTTYHTQQQVKNAQAGMVSPSGPVSYLCHWYFDKAPYVNHANTRVPGREIVMRGVGE